MEVDEAISISALFLHNKGVGGHILLSSLNRGKRCIIHGGNEIRGLEVQMCE